MDTLQRGLLASLLVLGSDASKVTDRSSEYIYGTSITGVTQHLDVARTPALYTGAFGDCLGGLSLFNITKFDAAYYTDNSTVLFHLDGQSSVANESLMMRLFIDAYGENRFQMTFDPCFVNIHSLCPLNASVPVTAWAVFPVGAQQVGDIPSLAFNIPDFEGSVTLQIFANSTQSEIGCIQSSLTNGHTMSYPKIMSPILGFCVVVAMLSSFASAAYGTNIPVMRTHYAHSLPVMVVLETFQSIFFSGALQLNYPSILTAWWSNFAWSAGQVYSKPVVSAVEISARASRIAREITDARPAQSLDNIGTLKRIYGSFLQVTRQKDARTAPPTSETRLQLLRRYNASDPFDYTWAGTPVEPGVALPGTWTGFSGTLGALGIPSANALALGLIWLLISMIILTLFVVILKLFLEALVCIKPSYGDNLVTFRKRWARYTAFTILRTLLAAFAMIMTLSFHQLSLEGSAGVKALASVVFFLFFVGLNGLVFHACYVRLRGTLSLRWDRILVVRRRKLKVVPYITFIRVSMLAETEPLDRTIASGPWFDIVHKNSDRDRVTVHEDEPYIVRYGWLSARYRRTRWWFFAVYLAYQLVRAAVVGGGSATPVLQVYQLLSYDITAFCAVLTINPFEARRNTALGVWMLGISKILTTGLSIAFLPEQKLGRILTTTFGIIIIAIQGLVTIGVMVLVVLSAISSYISITRDRVPSKPRKLKATRTRYLSHLEEAAIDISTNRIEGSLALETGDRSQEIPSESFFTVHSIKRVSKIYDEDENTFASLPGSNASGARPHSVSIQSPYSSRPRAARALRASWNSQDFAECDVQALGMAAAKQRSDPVLAKRLSSYSAEWYSNALGSFEEEHDEQKEESMVSGAGNRIALKKLCSYASGGASSTSAFMTPGQGGHGVLSTSDKAENL